MCREFILELVDKVGEGGKDPIMKVSKAFRSLDIGVGE